MMQPQHKRHARRVGPLAIASLLLGLTACGGGSNEQDTGKDPTVGQTVPGKVTLTGVVSKGRMAGAQVTAHPVKNGVVDASTVLATGLTDTNGRFDLPAFVPTAGSPVVVLVKITDKTVHVDELSQKPLPLPSTFTMRSAVVPAAVADDKTVTLPVNITPFSEMVVRAAESAPARLDKASVAQGKSAVTQMLGFDPIATDVSGVRASNTVAVNAQGLMLAAVAQLATGPDSEALGCKKSTAGEAIACTVDKLAQAAKLDTVKLVVDKVDVGAGLSRAIDAVSGNETVVPKDVDLSTTVGDVTGRLACEPGSATRPCEVPKVDEQTTGVAAAKAMFTALRTALNGWFSRGGLAGAGQLNQDATAFEAALTRARFPLDQISQDLAVMQLGIQLYEDYMSGRTTDPSKGTWKGRAPGHQKYTWANGDVQKYSGTWEENTIGCTLFQADKKTPATEPSNVAEIGCRSSFRMEIERIAPTSTAAGLWRVTDWRHGFTLMPGAAGASGERVFTYTSSASKRVRAIACTGSTDPRAMSCGTLVEDTALRVDLQLDADGKRRGFGGSIAVSPQGSRTLTLKVSGQLPGLIDGGTAAVVNDHQAIALTTQDDGSATSVMALAGKVQTFEKIDLTTASSTLELTPGSQVTFIASNEDGSRPAEGAAVAFRRVAASRIGLIWRTDEVMLSGSLSATDGMWDRSGRDFAPSQMVFSGQLDRLVSGSQQNWIKAELSLSQTGWDKHDRTQPVGEGNPAYTVKGTFSGTVTPTDGKPPFYLSLSTSKASNAPAPKTLTGTLRMGSGDAPKVNIQWSATTETVGDMAGAGAEVTTVQLHETVRDLTLVLRPRERITAIRHGSAQVLVGNVDLDRRRVNYTDLTFESLDLGL